MSAMPPPETPRIATVTVSEARQRLADAPETTHLLDVREVWEFTEGHAEGAHNLPLSQLQQRVGEVPRDRDILLICHTGARSMQAAKFLTQQGVTRVANVTGGTEAWENAGLPLEPGTGPGASR